MPLEKVDYDGILELVVSATKGIPHQEDLVELLDDARTAQERGYFLPAEAGGVGGRCRA